MLMEARDSLATTVTGVTTVTGIATTLQIWQSVFGILAAIIGIIGTVFVMYWRYQDHRQRQSYYSSECKRPPDERI